MLISKKVRSLPSMDSFIITLKFERIHVVVNESALVGAPLLLGLLVAEILTPHLQHPDLLLVYHTALLARCRRLTRQRYMSEKSTRLQ